MRTENFIYFITICGFFIGLVFSILNFDDPESILFYTLEITLVFYLIIHVAAMNFFDVNYLKKAIFNKQQHEDIGDYFIKELEVRERVMDNLLSSIEKMNKKYETIMKGSIDSDEPAQEAA
ncbi:MAG: hypothetical protein PHN38_00890 [Sulfurospirillaceae bacterium]|nr:hypothetical protein [Sulfurospirillaceae bacterium]MDD3462809.1 hypothetical protein [Sulfurospirillaceae bacterium]